MLSRKSLSILALVFLILLAGCSGVPFVGNDSKTPTPTNNTTTQIEYPYGWNETGMQKYATKQDNPILSESSVTFHFERTISLADSTTGDYQIQSKTEQVHKVNDIQKQWYIHTERQQSVSEYFFTDGKEYARTAVIAENGSVISESFYNESVRYKEVDAFQVKGAEMVILTTRWEAPTVTSFEGKKALHYEASGTQAVLQGSPIYNLGQQSNLETYSAELYVDKKTGNILSLNVTVKGTRGSDAFKAEFHFAYSNFSNTTVKKPKWVNVTTPGVSAEEFKNALNNSSNTSSKMSSSNDF